MKLTILGSGTCAVTRERACSCYCLEAGGLRMLLDIGFGSLRRLAEAKIFYNDIDVVICSHLHLDHVGDLAPLMMALHYTPGLHRKQPLTLIGPRNFTDFLQKSRALYGDWLLDEEFPINIHTLDSEQITLGACSIRAESMKHTPFSNGYRIEADGRVLAYSGDTGYCDQLIALLRQADIALVECSNPDDQRFEYHLTPSEAGRAAQQADVKHLVLTHFYPPDNVEERARAAAQLFGGRITIAQDFQHLTL